jgi:ribonuclease III
LVPPDKLTALEDALSFAFNDSDLLIAALTHRSASRNNNERLEFLGDGALNFIAARALYVHYPEATEGELSRLRARLVRGETLADVARHLDLSEHLILGPGELKSGGFRRDSILADTVEALIGAVLIDGGFVECERVVLRLLASRVVGLNLRDELKDPKTRLQEYMQARQAGLPTYRLVAARGEAHAQEFEVEAELESLKLKTRALGSSRRRAEQVAAAQLLIDIEALRAG